MTRAAVPRAARSSSRLRGAAGVALAGVLAGAALSGCATADPTPHVAPTRTPDAPHDPIPARGEVTYLAQCTDDSRLSRPATFVLDCRARREVLRQLAWRGWGEYLATATGVQVTRRCEPTCADGAAVSRPVTVVADRLVAGEAAATYRRLTVTEAGGAERVYELPGINPVDQGGIHGGDAEPAPTAP